MKREVMTVRQIAILTMIAACLVGCTDEKPPAASAQHTPVATQPVPVSNDPTQRYEREIAQLKVDLQNARAAAFDQGWSGGHDQAISEAYPVVFADMGRVYLMNGPLHLTDVRLEVNYKAAGGGYFHILSEVKPFHIWRIPQTHFLDENGKQMSSDQKIVSVRVRATTRGKPLVKEGDTLDTAPDAQ